MNLYRRKLQLLKIYVHGMAGTKLTRKTEKSLKDERALKLLNVHLAPSFLAVSRPFSRPVSTDFPSRPINNRVDSPLSRQRNDFPPSRLIPIPWKKDGKII